MLRNHAGLGVHFGWELSPSGVSDTLGANSKFFSVNIVDSAHVGDQEAEEDSDNHKDDKGETVEVHVFLLSGVTSEVNKIEHIEQSKTSTDSRNVEDDFDITIGSNHLSIHGGSNWGDSEILTSGGATGFDLESTEELGFQGGGFVGTVEDSTHRSGRESSIVGNEFSKSVLISLSGVKGVRTEH